LHIHEEDSFIVHSSLISCQINEHGKHCTDLQWLHHAIQETISQNVKESEFGGSLELEEARAIEEQVCT
jgi:hypothetical protein